MILCVRYNAAEEVCWKGSKHGEGLITIGVCPLPQCVVFAAVVRHMVVCGIVSSSLEKHEMIWSAMAARRSLVSVDGRNQLGQSVKGGHHLGGIRCVLMVSSAFVYVLGCFFFSVRFLAHIMWVIAGCSSKFRGSLRAGNWRKRRSRKSSWIQ